MTMIKTSGEGLSSHRFTILLATLVLYLVVTPFFVKTEPEAGSPGVLAFNVLVLLVLIGNVYASTHRLRPLLIAGTLAVVGFGAFIAADASGNLHWEIVGFMSIGLLWIYSAASILRHVLTRTVVTTDILAGAVVVYLQIGLVWSVIFVFIETLIPGSFSFAAASLTSGLASRADFYQFTYFSFVTLTTLGYGDVLAVSPPAQSLAFLETALGQIYLAVLVARLLGLHLATLRSSDQQDG